MNIRSRLVLLGESTVGKTTLSIRLAKNQFLEYTDSTIGASFIAFSHNKCLYEIWDTAGQERYSMMCPMYYRDADIALMVFDVNRLDSFDKVVKNIDEVRQKGAQKTKFIIIGNKLDLLDNDSVGLTTSMVKDKLRKYHLEKQLEDEELDVIYFSAKTGTNLDVLLNRIDKFAKQVEEIKASQPLSPDQPVVIDDIDIPEIDNGSTCLC